MITRRYKVEDLRVRVWHEARPGVDDRDPTFCFVWQYDSIVPGRGGWILFSEFWMPDEEFRDDFRPLLDKVRAEGCEVKPERLIEILKSLSYQDSPEGFPC